MSMLKRVASVSLIAATTAVAAASPSLATTIRSGSATGPAYSGAVNSTLASATIVFNSTLSNVTCTSSSLAGTVNSDGSGVSISSASWSSSGGSCTDSSAGTAAITSRNTPWSGGNVTYTTTGGKNGTLTLANMYAKSVRADGITCYWRGSGTNNSVTMDVYNPDNTGKPVSGNPAGQANAVNETLAKDTTQPNSWLCPSTATMTGTYALTGTGGVHLWVTK